MKLSRRARRNAALVADHGPAKRATYCGHWAITCQACNMHEGSCLDPEHCPDYQDAMEYHKARLRQAGRLLEV